MDKPPQLKSDIEKSEIELTVSDAEESTSNESVEPDSKETEPDSTEMANALTNTEPNAKIDRSAEERNTVQSSKRAKEQEFLKAYKSKQIQTRLKFVAFTAVVFGIYLSGVYFVFNDNQKAASALRKFQIAPLFACLGERDIAHYAMTEFSDGNTKNTPGLIEERAKILDNSISEMEKTGKPAIFTRLGAEQMLMKFGDRATGLKFGDPLIGRFPELPSNYFWRAKTDLERMDYANSVLEYKQAAEKLEQLPKDQKQDWQSQFSKAVWASIFAGQADQAEKFLALFKKNGGGNYEYEGLQSEILLTTCANLAEPILKRTHFWNEKLAAAYERRIKKAASIADAMSYSDLKIDEMPEIYSFELKDQADFLLTASKYTADYFDSSDSGKSPWGMTMKARAALDRDNPKGALAYLNAIGRSRWGILKKEQEFIEASAMQKIGRPKEAVSLVDKYLNLKSYDRDGEDEDESRVRFQTTSNHYNRLLSSVKAKALCDMGQYEQALSLCKTMLSQNPHLIEPRLINIRCYQGLKDTKAEAEESKTISSELDAWLNSAESQKHD